MPRPCNARVTHSSSRGFSFETTIQNREVETTNHIDQGKEKPKIDCSDILVVTVLGSTMHLSAIMDEFT